MVTMEGCVNVVGVAGRYLGLEEPVKLIRGWVFLAVLVDEIGATVEDGVRCVVTEIEKEGLVFILLNEFQGLFIYSVG